MDNILEKLIDDGPCFSGFHLECMDCDLECDGWCGFGYDPELKFECPACHSRNTVRTVREK